MCTATEASEDDLALDVWVDDKRVLQLDKDAAMAGTCWGSCAVAVEEIRKLRARRVASSVVMGAMIPPVFLFLRFVQTVLAMPHVEVQMKKFTGRALEWVRAGSSGQGSSSNSFTRAECNAQ